MPKRDNDYLVLNIYADNVDRTFIFFRGMAERNGASRQQNRVQAHSLIEIQMGMAKGKRLAEDGLAEVALLVGSSV